MELWGKKVEIIPPNVQYFLRFKNVHCKIKMSSPFLSLYPSYYKACCSLLGAIFS